MKELSELIQIVTKSRTRKTTNFNERNEKVENNVEYKLYTRVRDGIYKTDFEAAKNIYSTTPDNKTYLMLKTRVKRKLYESLFYLNPKALRYSDSKTAYYRINKYLLSAKIMLMNGALESGFNFMKRIIVGAQKYNFTEVSLQCAESLRQYYAQTGNEREVHKYDELISYNLQKLKAEFEAKKYLQEIITPYTRSLAFVPELADKCNKYAEIINRYRKLYGSFILHHYYFYLKANASYMRMNYRDTIKWCTKGGKFILSTPEYYQDYRLGHFLGTKMLCYLNMTDFESGKRMAVECLKLFPSGSNLWFETLEHYFLMSMRAKKFKEAEEILKKVKKHKSYKNQFIRHHEKWFVFEAYLKFLQYCHSNNKLKADLRNLSTYCRETPEYKRDKRGYNIAIMTFDILYNLLNRNFDAITKRDDALRVYTDRHLGGIPFARGHCFIKMIRTMIKEYFDYKRTKSLGHKYFLKLLMTKLNYQGNLSGLEIISYEVLWHYILNILKEIDNEGLIIKTQN